MLKQKFWMQWELLTAILNPSAWLSSIQVGECERELLTQKWYIDNPFFYLIDFNGTNIYIYLVSLHLVSW
jgi:hypothetical protein